MTALLETLNAEAAKIVARYEKKGAATLPLLHLAQSRAGYITQEAIEWVSRHTEVPPVHVKEVVSFYTMYHKSKPGKYHIRFCTSPSCCLLGAEGLLKHLKEKLGIESGETSSDGRFSIEEAECLGACEIAPMMQVNEPYYGNLDEQKINALIDPLKKEAL